MSHRVAKGELLPANGAVSWKRQYQPYHVTSTPFSPPAFVLLAVSGQWWGALPGPMELCMLSLLCGPKGARLGNTSSGTRRTRTVTFVGTCDEGEGEWATRLSSCRRGRSRHGHLPLPISRSRALEHLPLAPDETGVAFGPRQRRGALAEMLRVRTGPSLAAWPPRPIA